MSTTMIEDVNHYLEQKAIPVSGVADARILNEKAPEGFRPQEMLAGARTVLVAANPLPLSVFQAPRNNGIYSFYTAAFHTYYQMMNEAMNNLCLMIQEAGHAALPLPSYSPLRFHNGEPRGLISLKHAAVEAGLGKMGKNTLLIHPEAGNILRLGGLITTMEWPAYGTPQDLSRICPGKCDLCRRACPAGALSEKGIDIMKCMGNCIDHTLMPPIWNLRILRAVVKRSRFLTRFMDQLTLSMFANYGVSCFACLKACPHFPGNRKSRE
ncbi:MAG: hypothetical protein SWH61_12855 [Thermodesulfobacteriota bacterium]|nr:hypothetical protein [Thermodesulfobacteriota bacterium]